MNDKPHLLRFGYAPGNYWFVCRDCGNKHAVGDKRSTRCEACAESLHAQITSVEAVADKHRAMTTLPEEAVKAADIIQVITDLRSAILQDDDEGLAEHAAPMVKAKELIVKLSALEPSAAAIELSGISGQLNLATDMGNPITDKTVKMVLAEAIAQVWYQTRDCDVEEIDRIIAHLNRNGLMIVGIQRFKMMADAIQSAAAYLALSQPNSAEKLIADLDAALKTEVGNPATEPSAARELALKEAARECEKRGAVTSADAILALSSPDHPDAGKVEGDGWKPIESAPKDGTVIQVWHQVHKCPISVLWKDDGFPYRGKRLNWYERTYTTAWPEHVFFYWRPLPSAPSEGAE